MKHRTLLLIVLFLSGCAHHAPKVDCDGHLTHINPPNPVVKTTAEAPKS